MQKNIGKRIKIGILTFHNGFNYGAYLQAYALQNVLENIGLSNTIINYKNIVFTLNEYKVFLFLRNPLRIFENAIKIIKFKLAQRLLKTTRRIFNKEGISKIRYDMVLIGSDSVWNYSNPLGKYDPVYFSDGLNARSIVSYAASFGPDTVGQYCPSEIGRLLDRIKYISVRDVNSKEYVKALTGRDAELVLDPTFLCDFASKIKKCKHDNFILVYSLGLKPHLIEEIRKYADETDKKIISIGYRNKGCDINVVPVDPFEWLGYVIASDLIITSMYHGTLFSIKYNKEFCTIITRERANKLRHFMADMGLEKRMIDENGSIRKVFTEDVDWQRVNQQLNGKIIESKSFLMKSIGGGQL